MKGFVIYLTVFFIVVSIFRAQIYKVDTNSSKFDHNPILHLQIIICLRVSKRI